MFNGFSPVSPYGGGFGGYNPMGSLMTGLGAGLMLGQSMGGHMMGGPSDGFMGSPELSEEGGPQNQMMQLLEMLLMALMQQMMGGGMGSPFGGSPFGGPFGGGAPSCGGGGIPGMGGMPGGFPGGGGGYPGGGIPGGGGEGGAPAAGATSGGPPSAQPSGNVASWIQQAKQAMAASGMDVSNISDADLNTIIQHESGGNPNAINNWDSNAKAGHPSKGLMQTIDSTFNQNALPGHNNIYNPVDNIIAGTRYAISRYGSVGNVPGVRAVHNGGSYVGY